LTSVRANVRIEVDTPLTRGKYTSDSIRIFIPTRLCRRDYGFVAMEVATCCHRDRTAPSACGKCILVDHGREATKALYRGGDR
jgi:hypothetical protein